MGLVDKTMAEAKAHRDLDRWACVPTPGSGIFLHYLLPAKLGMPVPQLGHESGI